MRCIEYSTVAMSFYERAVMTALALLGASACGTATPAATHDAGGDAYIPPVLAIARADDLGPQTMPTTLFGRDGGQSVRLGASVLWTFGDTFLNTKAADGSNVRSSTAAWGTPLDPLHVTEPLDANGVPFQMIPYTTAEAADNAKDAQTGWALWAGAPFDDGAGGAVVLFSRVRRSATGFTGLGTGVATIKPPSTTATRLPGDLFTAPEVSYESGALTSGGYVYLYACGFHCKVTRAPVAQIATRASYQFYDGASWQSDASRAADVIKDAGGLSVRWNPYLQRFLGVYIRFQQHALQLRTALAPEGPWTDAPVVLDDPIAMPPAIGADQNSYLALHHTEFDAENGKVITVGYSRPTGPFRGEIRFVRITLR